MLKNPGCKDEEVKRIIENTQKEVAAKNIVNEVKNGFSIVSNGENSKIALSEVLIVRSKSVIAADYLFHTAFRELQNNPTEKQQERIINFCISWAAANRGTTEFTKAQNSLESIAKLAHIPQDKRDVLLKIIQRRPIPTPTPVFESATPVSLKSILMNIGTQDLSSAQSQKAIAQMANDLLTINNRLYQGLDRTDLAVSKWQNGYSPSAKNITNFFNQLTSYITYTIVGEQNVEKQKQGIKFFIAVAEECKQRNDIASLKSILGALNSALIMNLKTSKGTSVLEEVVGTENKPTKYGLLLKEANTLTSEASNSKELRKFYEDSQNKDILVTPYIGTFLQESTFLEDQPQLATTALEETANFAKLSKLIETENKFLNFKQVAGPDTDLIVTDIYSQVTDLKVPQEFLDLRKYDLDARRLKENLSRFEMRQLEKALTGNNAGKPPSEKVAAALKAALTLQKHIALMNASAEFPALQDQVRRFAENAQYPTLQKALNDLANAKNPLGAIPYFKKVLEELDNFSNVPELKNLTTALQQSAFAKYVKL